MSNHDVERLLCGQLPKNGALEPLAPMLSAFHDVTWPSPSEEAVARFASQAAAIARLTTSSVTPKPSPPTVPNRFLTAAIQRGLATGLAGALLISGLVGVAVASDDAAPGDLLYGLDRALESIGVGAGGASERIAEARALLEQGRVAEAAGHASLAVDLIGDADPTAQHFNETANAAVALRSAAGKLGAGDDGDTSVEVRAALAAMLNEMASMLEDPALEGKNLGQSVAEMARLLGANDSSSTGSGEPGNPEPGNADQALTPPFDSPPDPADDSAAAPAEPPGKTGDAPGKADSSPGKSGGAPGNPQISP